MRRVRATKGIWMLALTVCSIGLSCGPRGAARHAEPVGNDADGRVLDSEAVELIEAIDRPTIQIVRRKGDPHRAFSVAIFTAGGSLETVGLTALLRYRLKKASLDALFRPSSVGLLFVVRRAAGQATAPVLKTIHEVLHKHVDEHEIQDARLSAHFDALLKGSDKDRSQVGLCLAELGAEGSKAIREGIPTKGLAQWLEEVRSSSVVASRVGLASVGDGALIEEVKKLHALPWVAGAPIDDSWTGGAQMAVLGGQGARELRIGLRVADTERALSAGRALKDMEHPLRTRLRGLSSNFSVGEVSVALRPAGACLSVRVVLSDSARSPSVEQLAAVSVLVSQELEGATDQSLSEEERSLALVEPRTVDETAALAAWSAVRSPLTGASSAQLIEYRDSGLASPSTQQFAAAIKNTQKKWEELSIPLKFRDERGQPQLYMLLGTPCGTVGEPAEETGLLALTVRSLAKQFSGQRGVELIPYVHAHGIGLIARASRMRKETSQEHAERVGRALAAALSGVQVDGRAVAEARAQQLRIIGSDPGAELVVSVFGGEAVSALEPLGNENVVSALSTNDVERTREELAQAPLRLAVLANQGQQQAQIAERAVSQWLGSVREHGRPCVVTPIKPAAPGQWTLETLEEQVSTGAYIGAWAPVRPEVGEALAHFLWQRPELLSASASQPPPPPPGGSVKPDAADAADAEAEGKPVVRSVDVVWRGNNEGGALIARLGATVETLDKNVEDTRLGLQELSTWGLKDEVVKEMQKTFERRRAAEAEQPIGRVVDLWRDQAQSPPTARELKVLTQHLKGDEHRIVLVKRRK